MKRTCTAGSEQHDLNYTWVKQALRTGADKRRTGSRDVPFSSCASFPSAGVLTLCPPS